MKNEEKKENYQRKYYKNIAFIGIILILTFKYAINLEELKSIPKIITSIDKTFIFMGIGIMIMFFLCQSYSVKKLLETLGYKIKISQGFRYTLIDYYFSAITPGAIGGQPAEIYYMRKDGIDIGSSSLVMLIFNGLYHMSVVLVVLGAGFGNILKILEGNKILLILFTLGMIIQITLSILFFLLVFSKSIIYKLRDFAVKIMGKLKMKNLEEIESKINSIIKEYKKGSKWIYNNPKIFIKIIPVVILHISLYYSIGYFISRSFGINNLGIKEMIAYQGVYINTFESLPLPGGVGLAETGFLQIFSKIYSKDLIPSALILTRGITYYGFLIFGGMITILTKGEKVKKTRKTKRSNVVMDT